MPGERASAIADRRRQIIDLVDRRGFVTIDELATKLAVSMQTVRRDVRALARQDRVRHYRGGAGIAPHADPLAYSSRKVRYAEEKRAIARSLAAEIPDGASVFIDIGTTMEAVAEALLSRSNLRIITNHMTAAAILSENAGFEIILPGGILRNHDRAITGGAAADFVRGFKVSYGIFGIGTIDADGALLDYDYRDVELSAAAMAIARQRFVALDHSKFSGDAMVRVGHVRDLDAVFADAAPPPELAETLAAHGVRVVVADTRDDGTTLRVSSKQHETVGNLTPGSASGQHP